MGKSNVNPNHYKVAGRERQGEDIAQARHKQKHAESVVRRRTELSARSRQPAPQEAASPHVASLRAATTAAPRAHVTPLQTSPRQKRGSTVARGSAAPNAGFQKATVVPVPRPAGASPQLITKLATKKAGVAAQGPAKRMKQSMAAKRTVSRGGIGVLPAAGAGVEVLGNGLSRRRPEPRT